MKTKTFLQIIITSIACTTVAPMFGVIVPAGTTLVVRTLHNISAVDAPGKAVAMQLDKGVVVNGKVALPAGTKISGRVETSKRTHIPTRSQKLTVNITDAQVHGRTVAIKTTGAANLENPLARTTQRGVQVSTFGYVVPAGGNVQFRLAKPLEL
jgi:hypothetical protein